MYQGGGIEGVIGLLSRHLRRREFPQLIVYKREQVRGGPAVAFRGSMKQAAYIGHDVRV